MTALSINTFLAALFYTLAGTSGLVRHFLLEPQMVNYPRAPKPLLLVFFLFSTVLLFFGMRAFCAWWMGEQEVPPAAAPTTVLLAFSIFVYKISMLINILHQRYPAEVWRRLNRINTLVKCSPRP